MNKTGAGTAAPDPGRDGGIFRRVLSAYRRLPLFVQIFAVVLAAVACAQTISLASLLLVRMPQPPVVTLAELAQALGTGEPTAPDLDIGFGAPPAEADQDRRDLELRAALAEHLGIAADRVRVRVSRPPGLQQIMKSVDARADLDGHASKPGRRDPSRSQIIVGGFEAALHLDDGRWRVAAVRGSLVEPWQWQTLSWLLGTLLVATPLAWLMARRVAEPVRLFSAAAHRLGRDPGSLPLPMREGPPEIVEATRAFNDMQDRLKRHVDDRTIMIAAIAHDLRTPLMRITLLLDEAPAEVRQAAEAEIREMTQRIGAALALVRDVAGPTRRHRLDLRSLVESVADTFVDSGADVVVAPGDDMTVDADIAGLRSLFANLVENAVRYGLRARLTLRRANGSAIVEIDDDGPGIAEAELEKVFAPFYRLDRSRSRDTGGTGLGLASVRAVARSHGGDVTLHNRPGGGLSARVEFPLAEVTLRS
ncbi:HAMP domain-containing protein [Xanthobacter autotrophicus]|uniref:sensor histidine kinase n=1 Tax=Xanthobacter autotrophicus TaxID=280 RepID=UPI001E33C6CE|nr:ATP-binding protein [Xanthobacter autotrophicus]UDQ88438.1 HAMP domain-containing protein [Xanthobacter autotrophicus]